MRVEAGGRAARRAAPVDHPGDEFAAAVQAEICRTILVNRLVYPLGVAGLSLVLVVALWSELARGPLLAWLAAALLSALGFAGALVWPGARWLGRDGLPVLLAPTGYLVGVVWGSLAWVDLAALDQSVTGRSICLVALMGLSIGAHSPTVAGTAHPLRVDVPMATLALAAYLWIGYYPAVAGLLLFLTVVVPDALRSRRLVVAGIEARVAAARAAVHDPLTGLANRTGALDAIAALAGAGSGQTTVLFIDLDRFKQVNDRYGHAAGDELLCETARRLTTCFRSEDVVARLGGDEFVVILDAQGDGAVVDPRDPSRLARRVITALEKPFSVGGRDVMLSASVGIASLPHDTTAETLLSRADQALFRAKRDGRRRVVRYDAALGAELEARAVLELALRHAVRERTIVPYAQPVFSLHTGQVVSAELLARWIGQDGRFVSPMEFITLAEEVGLIRDLGVQMLGHAVQALQGWQQVPELAGASIAVNISPLHVVDGLLDDVVRVLADAGVRPESLTLEITEQQALPDEDGTKDVLEAVRALGVRIAIDDFGSGFSSIRWLTSLPVQVVKLDRSLLEAMPSAQHSGGADRIEVLRSVNRLAEAMGRTAVAEGIETEVELSAVRDAGIGLGQGYLLCRPMPLSELTLQVADICAAAERIIRPNAGTGTPPSRPRREGSSGSAGHRAPR